METTRRRLYLINPTFQLKFIGFISILCTLSCLIFLGCNLAFFYHLRTLATSFHIPPSDPFYVFLEQQQKQMNFFYLISLLVVLSFTFSLGLWFSHRIAGAIHRIKNHIIDASQNNQIGKLELRKSDFFLDLAEAINILLKK